MADLTLEIMKDIMKDVAGGDILSDDILMIVVEEVNANGKNAITGIQERATGLPEHPAAWFLLGFAAAGAIAWILD